MYYCNELRMTKKNEFLRVIHGIEMSFIFKFKLLLLNKKNSKYDDSIKRKFVVANAKIFL